MSFEALDQLGIAVFRLSVSEDGVATYDWWNSVAVGLSGKSPDTLKGLDARQIFGGRFGKRARDHHQKVAETGQAVTYRVTLPTLSGEREFQTVLTPIHEDGRVRWIWGTSMDITGDADRRRADALRQSALEESERFVMMAAHDLRTPMRNVSILVEELREDFEDMGDGKVALLDHLERVADKAERLIADVLVHARATGVEELPHEVFHLSALAADIFGVLDPEETANLTADDVWLRAERPTLQIILRNLVDNALKHGGQKDLRLHIGVSSATDGLHLRIADNGCGFDDPAVAFLGGGEFRYDTGFGLLGLRQLVEGRGGTIRAENREGGGSVILVRLPGSLANAPAPASVTVQDVMS